MTDRVKHILIGSFVAIALGICAMLVLFLKPTIGDGKNTLKVRFINIAGINRGTRVTYAGRPVGEVARVEEIPNARLEAVDEIGRVFSYQLTLRFDSRISVYSCDEIAIRSTGLMGEKSVAILPKAAPEGCSPELISTQILYANSIDPLDNTIQQMGRLTAKAEQSIEKFNDWFKETAPLLSHASLSLKESVQTLDSLLTSVADQEIIPTMKKSLDLAADNMRILRSSLTDDALLSRVSTLVANLNDTLHSFNTDGAQVLGHLNKITHDLAAGSGTIGRLFKGEDFYLRLNSLMSKSETLMNDINHYGLLFQYNKSWQRIRTKKINQMQALDSPEEFKTYFEGELDAINTSLGRITELMKKAEQDEKREKIVNNTSFRRDFSTLLRSVQALGDSVRLYNENLVAKLDE